MRRWGGSFPDLDVEVYAHPYSAESALRRRGLRVLPSWPSDDPDVTTWVAVQS